MYKYDNSHIVITKFNINETKTVPIVFCGSAENNECIRGYCSNSGVSCEFNKYHCMDLQYGHTFWNNLEGKYRISDQHTILYYGYAEMVTDYTNAKNNITTYVLNSQNTTFAFKITEETSIYQIIALRALHPRILMSDNKNSALNQILQYMTVGNTGVQD